MAKTDSCQLLLKTAISSEICCLRCHTVTRKWKLEENWQRGITDRSVGPQNSVAAIKLWYLIEKLVFVLKVRPSLELQALKGATGRRRTEWLES